MLHDFELQLYNHGKNATIKSTMINIAEQIRKQVLRDGPVWKPGKLQVHTEKRKSQRHIPDNWTDEDYNNKILDILNNTNTEIYWYYKEGFYQNFFVYGLPDWIVMIGENGVMESAYIVDRGTYNNYLTEEAGYKKLGMVGGDENND